MSKTDFKKEAEDIASLILYGDDGFDETNIIKYVQTALKKAYKKGRDSVSMVIMYNKGDKKC